MTVTPLVGVNILVAMVGVVLVAVVVVESDENLYGIKVFFNEIQVKC